MRVTDNATMRMVVSTLQQQQERIYTLQQQVSSGMRINAPSDDPVSAQQALNMKVLIAANDQYSRNISTGNTWLAQMDTSLSDMNSVMVRARELATQMANGIYDVGARKNAANEIQGLKDQLISLGNTQIGGKYIFGGFVSDQPPFDTNGIYNGTDNSIEIKIDQQSSIAINYSGGELLRGKKTDGTITGDDIIVTLDKLISALTDITGDVKSSIGSIDSSIKQIQVAQGEVGARENRLEKAGEILTGTRDYLTKALSEKQDVDFLQVLSDLNKQQIAYQATLEATARFSKLSLLDYMR